MNADRWKQIEQVLDVALASDPSSWQTLLDSRCSGDAELRREVEALLARVGEAKRFLTAPPQALAAAALAHDSAIEPDLSGSRVGPYRLVERIGRGGMARVYLAERADGHFQQSVAVKLLRPGLDSQLDLSRFRRERQILAALSHENIARLLDGGVTESGVPYLVMEYVDGEPITAYCWRTGATVRQRLNLFVRVLEATQYAHRSLVVHRDLKPSNIHVSRSGVVKLLDFGLARLLEPGASASSDDFAPSEQRWMTPEYAAPEQIRGGPFTTLTDVFQLGVVLYELLARALPFGSRARNTYELQNAILTADAPAPSRVVSDAHERRHLRGDLDAIVLNALHKQPEQRYASAQEFADDIRRYLEGRPVAARRRTRVYVARRFVQRNRTPVAAGVLLLLTSVAYVASLTAERNRVRLALAEARLGEERAAGVADFLLGIFRASEGGRALGDTVTARALLDRALAEARATREPRTRAQMLDVVGRLHTDIGNYAEAVPLLDEALAVRRKLHRADHPDAVATLENLARAVERSQDLPRAVLLRKEALELRRGLSGDSDPRTATALYEFAFAQHAVGNWAAARPIFDEWLALISSQPAARDASRATALTSAAELFRMRGDLAAAEPMYLEALAIRRSLHGDTHPAAASSLTDLAILRDLQFRRDEADSLLEAATTILRAAYPQGHPQLASTLSRRGVVLHRMGRSAEALAPLRESLAIYRRVMGDGTVPVAAVQLSHAAALLKLGSFREAENAALESERIYAAHLGAESPVTFFARAHIGDALRGQGRLREAETLLTRCYERFANPTPTNAQWRRFTLGALVRLYESQNRVDEASRYRDLLESAA